MRALTTIVRTVRQSHKAWDNEYSRLARTIVRSLPFRSGEIVEIGCGRGRLTIALARHLPSARIVAIDRFVGPYSHDRTRLEDGLIRARVLDRVHVVSSDGLVWLGRRRSRIRALITGELLPELSVRQMERLFRRTFRTLEDGGRTVHAFLSPVARNQRQRLTIEADSDPRWTRHPPTEWFAPPPKAASTCLRAAGFEDVRVRLLPSRIQFRGPAIAHQLRTWGVRPSFDRAHRRELEGGLELPDWILLSGVRKARGAGRAVRL